ncbi:MAG: hypothetical protein Tsb0032_02040 [Kiloniellaceae bacterium]
MLSLLIASNGWWLFQAVDLAATEKYRQQEEYEAARTIAALKAVTSELVRGSSKQQLIDILARALPIEDAFEKEGAIHVPFLSFPIVDGDSISGVQ